MPLALVTGAGGYVGNRLIDRLLASSDDWTVIAVDVRFSKPTQLPPGKVSRVQLDIRDADKLNNVFRDANVDVVFHIASFGMSGVPVSACA